MAELPEYAAANRALWDATANEWVEPGERNWASPPRWGIWGIPETELRLLPDDMSGLRAIELGCGTGYVSAWMTRLGAAVVGIDNSQGQLETAERLRAEHGLRIEFIHGIAEQVPFSDGSFDFAISEYGAALWSDPYAWIPEAHRLLRPGGRLVFLSSTTLSAICTPLDGSGPATETLQRPYFGAHVFDWRHVDDPGGVEFHLPTGEWFQLFGATGFTVDDFAEVQAPEDDDEVRFFATAEWAHAFPSEQVWWLTKL